MEQASQNIRENLERFGIADVTVVGILRNKKDHHIEVGRVEMLLSELCGLCAHGVAGKLGIDVSEVNSSLKIMKGQSWIGTVDCEGRFHLQSQELRDVLGWHAATDVGRAGVVKDFDLDAAYNEVLDTLCEHGTGYEAYFGPYFRMMESMFRKTSHFAGGYLDAIITVWCSATWWLGDRNGGWTFEDPTRNSDPWA